MMAYILQKTDYRLVSKYKKSVPSEVYIHFFYLSEEIHQENEQELESDGLLRASCGLWIIIEYCLYVCSTVAGWRCCCRAYFA